ncbi:MAG: nucleotidyltransferase family protein [Planctomycetes bacterium]|nr:nucleotidyltransferase family protein [Planctomycetota bacterium]
MKPSAALQQKRHQVRELFDRYRFTNPRVFGSVLHGDDTESSDLDIIVDVPPRTTLFDLGGITSDLEDLLGVRVAVLTPGELPGVFRERVLAEAEPV